MTRAQKLERIQKYRPSLYLRFKKEVPNLIMNPDNATVDDIFLYNNIIAEEAKKDNNNVTFKNNFSF